MQCKLSFIIETNIENISTQCISRFRAGIFQKWAEAVVWLNSPHRWPDPTPSGPRNIALGILQRLYEQMAFGNKAQKSTPVRGNVSPKSSLSPTHIPRSPLLAPHSGPLRPCCRHGLVRCAVVSIAAALLLERGCMYVSRWLYMLRWCNTITLCYNVAF